MNKKRLTLEERWGIDDEMGAEMPVYRCHRCEHYRGADRCEVYGTIPEDIQAVDKTCKEFAD